MKPTNQLTIIVLCIASFCQVGFVCAENIDPYESDEQYGYSENTGWLNAEPDTGDGMHVASDKVIGWVWGENIGWINLHCENNGTCGTASYGVVNDGSGNLSGFAWAENVGWINFDPTHGGVTIDVDGKFTGWAWGENIGWIQFDETQSWTIRACVVTLEDLQNFAQDWLSSGSVPGNLNNIGSVDMADYSIFASWWQDFCPNGWQLK